jgi:CheY-like chemotaxis protein
MGRSGTGLGLTVVWNTVEDHGGKVTVKSSKKGTCFTLYFPLTLELPASPAPKQESLQQKTGNERHVLIVDDEPQLRDIAEKMLTGCGYHVSTVSSGEEAVAFTRNNSVDLLIIDMLMEPGINGRQTYEQILEHRPNQKAIIASGFSENEDIKITLQLGAAGFIKKPYTLEQLTTAVFEALQQ